MNSSSRANEIISFRGIETDKRYEKFENVCSLVTTVRREKHHHQQEKPPASQITIRREKRQQKQEASPASQILQNALVARSKAKLLANEMELTELRKMIDAGKGGVPAAVSPMLLQLGCKSENISRLGGENYLLQKLEAVVSKKEDECHKARKLVAEARKQRGSTPRNLDLVMKKEDECHKAQMLVAEARQNLGTTPRNPKLIKLRTLYNQ
jgi:hypothetical protein